MGWGGVQDGAREAEPSVEASREVPGVLGGPSALLRGTPRYLEPSFASLAAHLGVWTESLPSTMSGFALRKTEAPNLTTCAQD